MIPSFVDTFVDTSLDFGLFRMVRPYVTRCGWKTFKNFGKNQEQNAVQLSFIADNIEYTLKPHLYILHSTYLTN